MRLRYSLLTLLLLTAVIAGGAKLWHGPHHTIEKKSAEEENEYYYTRSWGTEQIIHGPYVRRTYSGGQLQETKVRYWRQGKPVLAWSHTFYDFSPRGDEASAAPSSKTPADCPLSPLEQIEFQAAVQRERQRLHDQGLRSQESEGYPTVDFLISGER